MRVLREFESHRFRQNPNLLFDISQATMAALGRKLMNLLQRCRISMKSIGAHRQHIRNELALVRGLIPLLMKHRNGEKWTAEERATLLRDLRALSNLSPYLIPLLLPGGIFMLPLVSCWMDRRGSERKERNNQPGRQARDTRRT